MDKQQDPVFYTKMMYDILIQYIEAAGKCKANIQYAPFMLIAAAPQIAGIREFILSEQTTGEVIKHHPQLVAHVQSKNILPSKGGYIEAFIDVTNHFIRHFFDYYQMIQTSIEGSRQHHQKNAVQ